MDYQEAIDRVDKWIATDPGRVMLVFLVVTVLFAGGLGGVSTEAGTQQFAEETPENQALEDVNQEFSQSFSEDTGSTQLIQRSTNVLAKDAMLRMLATQERIKQRDGLRVVSTSSAAQTVATELDPSATTIEQQSQAIRRATPAEIDQAIRSAAVQSEFTGTVSDDFNRQDGSASATVAVVSHEITGGTASGAGQSGGSPLTPLQLETQRIVATENNDITVFGSGLIAEEFSTVIEDSLLIVTPAAVILITLFLVIAYRDPVDLALGAIALLMAIIWTFGFLGITGIPFNQIMIAVPPLLLAIGVDFGIHAINRYREDRVQGYGIAESMTRATDQLLVAFFIVTGTTVIGFLSNLVSDLPPIRDFGVVAAVGIVFTFLIFGVFLPSLKVWVDRRRPGWIPGSGAPLGQEGSVLGSVLRSGVIIARRAPVIFLVIVLIGSVLAGGYATGTDTSFTQKDFLPPEETPEYLQSLPEPFKPADYTVVAQLNFLEENFENTQGSQATVYLEGPMERDSALEEIHRANRDPPESIVRDGRQADATSIVSVVQSQADRDPEFRALVQRNDRDGNGIPDHNLDQIYDYLLDSPARDRTLRYLAEDRRSAQIVYSATADASNDEVTADTKTLAERHRMDATATGNTIVFKVVSDIIFESAIQSLVLSLSLTTLFLVIIYRRIEGWASLGVANTVPILISVAAVAASMRLLGISFNAFTATILALTIGLGIDYSVHVVQRFADERREYPLFEALDRTIRGTGGALTGSMLTTAFGIGVLVLAVLSVLGQFGVLTALSVVFSYLVSVLVLPSVLVLWDRLEGFDPAVPLTEQPATGGWIPGVLK
jgi:predicted RND superfamily exporter protein